VNATPATLPAKHLLVLAVALVASFPYGWRASASLALGGGIQIVNLRALERSVAKLLDFASSGRQLGVGLRLGASLAVQLRWVLVLGLVGIILLTLPVDPIALLIGLSTVVVAVLWHGFASADLSGSREP
jgi:hypothetical protein